MSQLLFKPQMKKKKPGIKFYINFINKEKLKKLI